VKRSRSKSSQAWLQRHVRDAHVQQSVADGYRSRAVYKLQQLDEKDQLLAPGMTVLELGAAPGGWTQYVSERVMPGGTVIASDILEMAPVADVHFIQGDFTEQVVADAISAAMNNRGADLVLSDMAPNLSGVASADQARSIGLAELALAMAIDILKPAGAFVVKLFQGEGFDAHIADMRRHFGSVKLRKPPASRDRSREIFAVARNLSVR